MAVVTSFVPTAISAGAVFVVGNGVVAVVVVVVVVDYLRFYY